MICPQKLACYSLKLVRAPDVEKEVCVGFGGKVLSRARQFAVADLLWYVKKHYISRRYESNLSWKKRALGRLWSRLRKGYWVYVSR